MPALRDRPFALVSERRSRPGLHALNTTAERAGLVPGMALADACAILPSLITLPAHPRDDARALSRLAGWCGRYSPWTSACEARGKMPDGEEPSISLEGAGGGGVWLDATGCAHLFGGEEAMLSDLTGRLARGGYAVRAAMADTPGCAWAVARFAPGPKSWFVVPPGRTRDALSPLPVAALRLSAATVTGLRSLGVRQVADLMALPPAPLAARFGPAVRDRLNAALGTTVEPISPHLPETPLMARLAFAEPIGRIEDIASALDRLLDMLCRKLEAAGKGARRLVLLLYRPDGTTARLAVGTARPRRDPAHLARLFAEHLDSIDIGFGIEDAVLAAPVADPLGADQKPLSGSARDAETDLVAIDSLVDRLGNRLGASNVLRPVSVASHLPERAAGFAPVSAGTAENAPIGQDIGFVPATPRPVRLLYPPEPVEAVADSDRGPPHLFRWRRVLHRVACAEGPERIAPEWWRTPHDPDRPVGAGMRDYYRVETAEGQRFWLYREDTGAGSAWYLHGLFG